jgi:hypothetical protein
VIWQPFGAVSVWHEFGPNVTSNHQHMYDLSSSPVSINSDGFSHNFNLHLRNLRPVLARHGGDAGGHRVAWIHPRRLSERV